MHIVKSLNMVRKYSSDSVSYLVDFIERHMASNEFIKLHFPSKIFFHELWHGITGLISSKGCTFPYTASYQLERSGAMISVTDNQ